MSRLAVSRLIIPVLGLGMIVSFASSYYLLGVLAEPAIPFCRIALAVACEQHERMPEPAFKDYVGLSIPMLSLQALESSAPAKLRRALHHLGASADKAYLDALAVGVSPRPGGESR